MKVISDALIRGYESDWELYQGVLKEKLEKDYAVGSKVAIHVPHQELSKHRSKYFCIPCKGSLGECEAEWAIASGHFSRVAFSVNGKQDPVNILDYLSQLVPRMGNRIGLTTYQNGIQNSYQEFLNMGNFILNQFRRDNSATDWDVDNFPERPLCIGLYNPMGDFCNDVDRTCDHLAGYVRPNVYRMRLMLTTFADLLERINPSLMWLHIIHSEAGAITHRAIKEMSQNHRRSLKKRMIIAAYGPAIPIPDDFAKIVWNVYSDKDPVTGRLAKPYLNKPGYVINTLQSEVKGNPMVSLEEHDFQGTTYKLALDKHLKEVRKRYGFYPKN
jgi:hypothetical protein